MTKSSTAIEFERLADEALFYLNSLRSPSLTGTSTEQRVFFLAPESSGTIGWEALERCVFASHPQFDVVESIASATEAPPDFDPRMVSDLERLIWLAEDQTFEDGMDSAFGRDFANWFLHWGKPAVRLLMRRSFMDDLPTEALVEGLSALAALQDPTTRGARSALFKTALWSESPHVRDVAALALKRLGDPRDADAIRVAISREQNDELRFELKRIADYLTPNC